MRFFDIKKIVIPKLWDRKASERIINILEKKCLISRRKFFVGPRRL